MSEDLTGRLSRWSQRKLAARRGDVVDEPAEETPAARPPQPPLTESEGAVVARGHEDVAGVSENESAPELPPIEELNAQSDYTAFLSDKVPEALQRAALRKLWTSDPAFGVIDGLDHYNEDYNVVDTLLMPGQTSYQVGKGYIDEIEEALAKLEPSEPGAETAPVDSSADSPVEAEPTATAAVEPADTERDESAKDDADLGDNAAPGDSEAEVQQVARASDDEPVGKVRADES